MRLDRTISTFHHHHTPACVLTVIYQAGRHLQLSFAKPVHYGYKSIHDLPTPPSTSRSFPPLIYQQESSPKPLPAISRNFSPCSQPMSGSHRGLPPPAAMTLAQPLPPAPPGPTGPAMTQVSQLSSQPSQSQHFGQLPSPPGWQSSEESMRAWLHTKAEEEKRRQEEEKTSQERLKLEQRRTEYDILQASLQGGIPPPMVPVVFAGMGGGNLPSASLEWAQQFMYSQAPQQAPQHSRLPPGPTSPGHRRDSQPQSYGAYPGSGGVPSTPGSAQGGQTGFMGGYPGSPPRARGYSMPGRPLGGGSNLPSLNTNVPQGTGGQPGMSHPGIASAQQQEQPQQQQPQQSPSIYFHMWQPPTSQGGQSSSNQPATPSVGESPRKRKATGPQQAAPPPSTQQRFRSPPFSHSTGSTLANPPPGRRRGHSRQRSDLASYRPPGRTRAESVSVLASQQQQHRGMSPMRASAPDSAREGAEASSYSHQSQSQSQQHQWQPPATRSGAHSVSSLLSSEIPSPHSTHYPPASTAEMRGQQAGSGEGEQRQSSEEKTRGGGAGPAAPSRERDIE